MQYLFITYFFILLLKKETFKQFLLSILCLLTVDKMIKINRLTKDQVIGDDDTADTNKKNILEN